MSYNKILWCAQGLAGCASPPLFIHWSFTRPSQPQGISGAEGGGPVLVGLITNMSSAWVHHNLIMVTVSREVGGVRTHQPNPWMCVCIPQLGV